MRTWFLPLLGLVCSVFELSAEPALLVNTLADRPVFSYRSEGYTQTRTLAPGNRLRLEAGTFSGLGEKSIPFLSGNIYYLANFGTFPGVYQLEQTQFLVLNESGRQLELTVGGPSPVTGSLAVGSLALGGVNLDGSSTLSWKDQDGQEQRAEVKAGQVYRLLLESPEGLGVAVTLVPWD